MGFSLGSIAKPALIGATFGGGGALTGAGLGVIKGLLPGGPQNPYDTAADAAARKQAADVEQGKLQAQADEEEGQRNASLNALDAAYKNPGRTASREATYTAQLQAALAGGAANYATAQRKTALAQAARGTLGGSTDYEQQAQNQAGYQSGVQDAASTAASQLDAANQSDLAQYNAYRNSILSSNPTDAASFASSGRTLGNQGDQSQALYDFGNVNSANRQGYGQANSQMYGSLLGSLGTSFRTDQSAKATGGQGLY